MFASKTLDDCKPLHLLDIVLLPPRVSTVIARRLESMLFHEAPDPNRSRQLLIERVESGTAWA